MAKYESSITLTYPIKAVPRYGHGQPPHLALYDLLNQQRAAYKQTLEEFLRLKDRLFRIPVQPGAGESEPCWMNGFLPGLDAVALYALVSSRAPKRYVEIGSGQSTRFARRAIRDQGLSTRIVSIDPRPRAAIDTICDEVIRQPLEDADLSLFDQVEAGDIVFFDGSHYCFMNSDATVFFLDILPRLKPGTLVQIHDVTLPYDYPPEWIERYYSEQYLLAVYLLTKKEAAKVIMPNVFVTEDEELSSVLKPLWSETRMHGVEWHGGSFWFEA